jgi:hypothetical protein
MAALTDAIKTDLLYKKYFGFAKTDTAANKLPSGESAASPTLLRGDTIWTQSNSVPTSAAAVSGIVRAHTASSNVTLTSVAITGTSGQFSCASTTLVVGQRVIISGTNSGTGSITGYTSPTTYVISATNGSTTFTLTALNGNAITTGVGTPASLTYTASLVAVAYADTGTVAVSGIYPTWRTGLIDWIPPEFDTVSTAANNTYRIKIYYGAAGLLDAATSGGTPISADADPGQWYFDYQAGLLHFLGGTLPVGMSASSVIYVYGYRYIGFKGIGANVLPVNNVRRGYTTTVTAAGTTTLTLASTQAQFFTGSTTQTVVLPVAATLAVGDEYFIENNSTGNITVNSSGGNLVATVLPGTSINVTCILASGITAASWDAEYAGFATATGTGSVVLSTSPTLVTPTLGAATATSINGLTLSTSTGTLTIANSKTLTANNTLTLTGTDASSIAFGGGGTVAYTANKLSVFAATTSAELAGVISDETGSGSLVFANTPTLVTPNIGAATATSITGTIGNLSITAFAGNNSVSLVPTGTGTVDVNSKRISSVAEPTQPQDAATKAYVDTVAQGLHVHEAARVATTDTLAVLSGGTVTYDNGTLGVGATLTLSVGLATLDGITLVNGDRILVKNQANAAHNGLYVRTSSTVLTRALDFDSAIEIAGGDFTFVEVGTLFGKTGWVQVIEVNTVGTDLVTFEQFAGQNLYLAGGGLTLTGNQFDVVGTANRITVAADAIDIASTYTGQNTITTLGTIGTGTWQGSLIGSTYGGTGVNNGSNTLTLAGNVSHAGAFTQTFTATANTSLTLPTTGTLATLAGTEALTNKTVNGLTITSTNGTLTLVNGSTLVTAGAFSTTLTATAATNVTLPTTGTLATLAGSESLSNKTITLSSFSGTTVAASGNVTFTSTTDASALGTAPVVLSGGLSVAKAMYIGTNITGAGPATSALDGFQIDCGTY